MIENYSDEYRNEYIEFISELSKKYDSFKWWVSSVAEKNIFDDNNLFKDLNNYQTNNVNENIFSLKQYYKIRRRFIKDKFSEKKKDIKFDNSKKYIGLVSWIDKRNFSREENFNESYFGKLYELLKKKDNLLLLPQVLYTLNNEKAINLLDKNNIKYIEPYKFYSKIDVIKSVLFSLWYSPVNNQIFFKNKKVTKVIKDYFFRDSFYNRYAQYYLMYYSIKRIAQTGITFDRIIYPFENQPWEKVLCYAVKKFFPKTKLIGYMHTMTLPNLVSIYPGEYEKENMPQPDYIFTAGKLTADELKKYWKPEKVIENCALRYEYLFEKVQSAENDNGLDDKRIIKTEHSSSPLAHRTFIILLALSVDYKKSMEMLEKTYLAFKDKNDYKIIVKGHPTYDFKSVQSNDNKAVNSASNIAHSTSHIAQFIITNKPVSELLPECALVLTSESTVGLEGIKMGIPMIEIDVEGFIPLSRFDYCPEIKISANSPQEIFEKVNSVLNWTAEKRKDYFDKANKFIKYCFNPVTDDMIEQFVEI